MKKTMLFAGLMAGFALCAGAETDFAHHVTFNVSGYAGEALADFPVLVRLSSKIPGFSYSLFEKADHSDLAFFAVDGETETACPYEIDTWNASGESLVWVKVPSLAKDKKLVARFGSQTASGNASAASVWSKYKAVWHMNPGAGDSVAGVSVTKKGSTSETSTDLLGAGYETTARGANSLATEYKFGNLSSSGVFTISGWFKHQYDNGINRIFSTKTSAGENGMEFIINKTGVFLVRGNGNSSQMSISGVMASKSPDKGSWLHIAGVYNGSNCEAYANAESVGAGTIATPGNYKTDLYIGNCGNGGNSDNCYVGVMDEVRVYDGVAPAGWIAAEYASVSNSTFLAAGTLDDDATVPSFASAPTLVEADGVCTFSVELATGEADIFSIVTDITVGITSTNMIKEAASAGPASAVLPLVNGHSYKYSAYAKNSTSGISVVEPGSGPFVCGGINSDSFTWPESQGGNWTAGDLWVPTDTERPYPFIMGDLVTIGNSATITQTIDAVVSTMKISGTSITSDGVTPVRLTLAAGDGQYGLLQPTANTPHIGEPSDAGLMDFAIGGATRIYFSNTTGNHNTRAYIYAKLTGGTKEFPSNIRVEKSGTGWNHAFLYLMNPLNDFRGDIVLVGSSGNSSDLNFRLGDGNPSDYWHDSALGDPANEIYLYGEQTLLTLTKLDTTEGLKRKVHGNGIVECVTTDGWGKKSYQYFLLGAGFAADPCTSSAEYGKLTIRGGRVSFSSGSAYRVSVGFPSGNATNDLVNVVPNNTTEFRGALDIIHDGEIPEGSSFTIMTVSKDAKTFTFEPSSVTPGWNTKCTGDADNGWRVVITKAREGADVANYPVSMIASDHVTANCEVLDMGGAASLTVRVYYGTTDGGTDPNAWSAYEEIPATAVGMYSKRIDGLDVNTTYYFRHAVMVGGVPVFSLDPAVSCRTVPVSHPDVFTWVAGSDAWMGTDVWSINTPYERHHPGYAGDAVKFLHNSSRTTQIVSLSGDETLGTVTGNGGNWDAHYSVSFSATEPSVLTFDNLGAGARFSIYESGLNEVAIGADGSDALTMRLADSLLLYRNAAFGVDFRIYAIITGGTAALPCPVTILDDGNEYANCKYYLYNSGNDFVGDLSLEKPNAGNDMIVYVGDTSHPYADSILGDAANKVAIGRYCVLQVGAGTQSVTWSREVSGAGILKSVVPLALASSARFTADSTAAPLRITAAGAISDAAGTTYAVTIDADDTSVASRISFSATAPLALNGTFVVSQDDPTVKVEPGTRWAIGSVDKSVGALSHTRFAYSGDFRVYAEGDAENGWTIYAERKTDGLFIIMR